MKKLSLFLLSIISSACVTQTPFLKAQEFKSIPASASGLIVPAEVRGSDGFQCRMEFSDEGGGTHRLFFDQGKDVYFAELSPGSYKVNRLACEHGSYYVENDPYWSRIVINPGTLSFFSPLRFNSASEKVLIQHPDREQTVEAYRQTLRSLASRDRERLVHAQDGKKLTEKMQDIQKVALFHFSANQPDGFESFKKSVMDCEQKELTQNHTVLGKTEYQLTYQHSKLQKMTGGARNTATFSPSFYECVEKTFQSYQPQNSGELKVTVSL
jgi:hypothetical protein